MLPQQSPGKVIWNGVASVELNPIAHMRSISLAQESSFGGFVGKVDEEEPCAGGDDLDHETFDDLKVSALKSLDGAYKNPLPASEPCQSF